MGRAVEFKMRFWGRFFLCISPACMYRAPHTQCFKMRKKCHLPQSKNQCFCRKKFVWKFNAIFFRFKSTVPLNINEFGHEHVWFFFLVFANTIFIVVVDFNNFAIAFFKLYKNLGQKNSWKWNNIFGFIWFRCCVGGGGRCCTFYSCFLYCKK